MVLSIMNHKWLQLLRSSQKKILRQFKIVNAVIKAMAWQSEHTDEELAKLVSPMFEGRDLVEIVGILRGITF